MAVEHGPGLQIVEIVVGHSPERIRTPGPQVPQEIQKKGTAITAMPMTTAMVKRRRLSSAGVRSRRFVRALDGSPT